MGMLDQPQYTGQLSVKLQTLPDCVEFVHHTAHLYVLQEWLDLFIQTLITYLANSQEIGKFTIISRLTNLL